MLPDVSSTKTRTLSVVSCAIINSGAGGYSLSSGGLLSEKVSESYNIC